MFVKTKTMFCLVLAGSAVLALLVLAYSWPVSASAEIFPEVAAGTSSPLTPAENIVEDTYILAADDELQVDVFGEEELSRIYRINGAGKISMPLIGDVAVGGLTISGARALIESQLADGYIIKPSVSVQIPTYRPFYIMGEVRTPGSYPYTTNMTVLNAAVVAGGFTYRADEDTVKIQRRTSLSEEPQYKDFPADARVMPGDIILVEESFF